MSKLSSEEREIAARCIVWHINYIDIGVIVHMDRRTVSRRMEKVILPELNRMKHTAEVRAILDMYE